MLKTKCFSIFKVYSLEQNKEKTIFINKRLFKVGFIAYYLVCKNFASHGYVEGIQDSKKYVNTLKMH